MKTSHSVRVWKNLGLGRGPIADLQLLLMLFRSETEKIRFRWVTFYFFIFKFFHRQNSRSSNNAVQSLRVRARTSSTNGTPPLLGRWFPIVQWPDKLDRWTVFWGVAQGESSKCPDSANEPNERNVLSHAWPQVDPPQTRRIKMDSHRFLFGETIFLFMDYFVHWVSRSWEYYCIEDREYFLRSLTMITLCIDDLVSLCSEYWGYMC